MLEHLPYDCWWNGTLSFEYRFKMYGYGSRDHEYNMPLVLRTGHLLWRRGGASYGDIIVSPIVPPNRNLSLFSRNS